MSCELKTFLMKSAPSPSLLVFYNQDFGFDLLLSVLQDSKSKRGVRKGKDSGKIFAWGEQGMLGNSLRSWWERQVVQDSAVSALALGASLIWVHSWAPRESPIVAVQLWKLVSFLKMSWVLTEWILSIPQTKARVTKGFLVCSILPVFVTLGNDSLSLRWVGQYRHIGF